MITRMEDTTERTRQFWLYLEQGDVQSGPATVQANEKPAAGSFRCETYVHLIAGMAESVMSLGKAIPGQIWGMRQGPVLVSSMSSSDGTRSSRIPSSSAQRLYNAVKGFPDSGLEKTGL
jgi:hypothetical protein